MGGEWTGARLRWGWRCLRSRAVYSNLCSARRNHATNAEGDTKLHRYLGTWAPVLLSSSLITAGNGRQAGKGSRCCPTESGKSHSESQRPALPVFTADQDGDGIPPDKLPMGKRVGSAVGDGEWNLETGTGITGNWRRSDSLLPFSSPRLSESSNSVRPTNQPARLATPATTPVLDPSVLAEMGDTRTNGTHPPAIQALPPSLMRALFFCRQTFRLSRVCQSPTRQLAQPK